MGFGISSLVSEGDSGAVWSFLGIKLSFWFGSLQQADVGFFGTCVDHLLVSKHQKKWWVGNTET